MKYTILALVCIVLIVALASAALSQGKRMECLQDCRSAGDICAERAYRNHAACKDEQVACNSIKIAALRQCQVLYDACRYECDIPRF